MGSNAMMMIHNAWSVKKQGYAEDMRKMAEARSTKVSAAVAQTYVGPRGPGAGSCRRSDEFRKLAECAAMRR